MEKKNAWEKYPEGTKRQDVFTFAEEYRKLYLPARPSASVQRNSTGRQRKPDLQI